jgi:predicted phage-related endonuclease
MKVINVQQRSKEWFAFRAKYNTASEASIMMMASKLATRDELLKVKATGDEKEISQWVKDHLFADGHRIEAEARPIAEEIIGEELYPVTGVDDNEYLLSSFDGLTMCYDIVWECKQWNEEKAATVNAGDVPECDYWQVVQQLVTSKAKKCCYMVTNGTKEKTVYVWKELNETDESKLMTGWLQFDEDVRKYEHVEVRSKAIAEPVLGLPAVSIKVDGEIVLIDNLDVFGEALKEYVGNINKEPKTDQDFANLEATIKVLKEAEDRLTASENSALAQAESIDIMRRKVELFRSLSRSNRLTTEKLVKNEKAARKLEIATNAEKERLKHQADLNQKLGGNYFDSIRGDFNGAMRGKKTIVSLQSAANDELARCKIIANELFIIIDTNLKKIPEEYNFLFNDLSLIVEKQTDDFALLVDSRISEHKKAEQVKLDNEREKIRNEEAAKAQKIIDDATEMTRKAEKIKHETSEKQKIVDSNNVNLELFKKDILNFFIDRNIRMAAAKLVTELLITNSVPYITLDREKGVDNG